MINRRSKEPIPIGTKVRIVSNIPANREDSPCFTRSMEAYLGKTGKITGVHSIGTLWYDVHIPRSGELFSYRPEWLEVL